MATTKLANIINPEVMGDMIAAKIPAMIKFTPFAKIDRSLVGVPGDTKTVPSWNFIGAAEDLEEGGEVVPRTLTASTAEFKIKCAAVSVGLSQKAINSGLGDPVGAAESQIAKALAVKIDNDLLAAALTGTLKYGDAAPAKISYSGIVDAINVFDEEEITEKVIFVAPEQITALRKDADFTDKNKYGNDVMISGEIGMISGARVVPSKKIVKNGDGNYVCPIIKLEPASSETEYAETELPALTVFLKEDVQVDHEWFPKKQTHDITGSEYYGVALTNASKVVVATFKA